VNHDVIASEAKQSRKLSNTNGLLRRLAPLRKSFAFVAGNDGTAIELKAIAALTT